MDGKTIRLLAHGLWLVAAVLLLLALFHGGWNRSSDDHDSVIRMGLESLPLRLDPRFATDATSARVNRLLFERLVDFDAAGRFVPQLADWTVRDELHYRFVLRAGRASFSDGKPVRSTDVVATYASVLDVATGSPIGLH